jgi:hypothetical protein
MSASPAPLRVHTHCRPELGIAIHRVAHALAAYAPSWVQPVPPSQPADFQVIHMLGDGERVPAEALPLHTFAIVQYMVRTTETPYIVSWGPLWSRAAAVWSYYDLEALAREDGTPLVYTDTIYHAPLGVDATIFRPCGCSHKYLVGTSGYVASTESVDEWYQVVLRKGARQFHLGPDLLHAPFATVEHRVGLTDREVAKAWGQCQYVSGLRRIEGFEFPAAEGLLCGSRPVLFDRPHYREWFGSWAEYIPEGDPQETVAALLALVNQPYRRVTEAERTAAMLRFHWPTLVQEFWAVVARSLGR